MAFKPKKSGGGNGGDFTPRNFPTPFNGSEKGVTQVRPARVSLIVDLGEQNRKDIYELNGKLVPEGTDGAETKTQKPADQVAVFVDLVSNIVDYGGEVGKQPYRHMLNKGFKGEIEGINFGQVPPKDANGKLLEGKPWTFHPQNMLTKLAKATGLNELGVGDNTDIEQLLDQALNITLEVKETNSGKKDKDGNDIVYKNVNTKGLSPLAPVDTGEVDDDGNPVEALPTVRPLKNPALCITFDNATKDDIKWIRRDLIKKIKLANNYAGSNMQKAIEAYEAETGTASNDDGGDDAPAEKPAAKPKAAPAKPKKPVAPNFSDMDDDIPF